MKDKPLTARQLHVLRLVAAGCSNKEIGVRMDISAAGVKKHLEALARRYKVSRRGAVVHAAIESGDLPVTIRWRSEHTASCS